MSHPEPTLPSLDDLRRARERLRGQVHDTPLLSSRTLCERTGARVHLKCENLQKTGSFKIRGALNACREALEEERARGGDALARAGVLTYSSGNHGQAVAFAARQLGLRATVVVPEDIPAVKRAAIEGYGARIEACGLTSSERGDRARRIAEETGARIIPPFDHPAIIAGQGSTGLEILEGFPEVEAILVPVGGGGLLAGIAIAAAERAARVFGVEPEGADAMARSLEAGRLVSLSAPPRTIADGLRPISPGELTLRAAVLHVEAMLRVDDEAILEAQRLLLQRAKLLVEPSGAAAVAALLRHAERFAGQEVVAVLSGGNASAPAW